MGIAGYKIPEKILHGKRSAPASRTLLQRGLQVSEMYTVRPYHPSPQQMTAWRKLEAEHTSSKAGQTKIVMDHVNEFGPKYYPALKKMEAKLKRR
jgi:hypothetical protein